MNDTVYKLHGLQSQRVMKLHSRDENNKVMRHKHQVPTSRNTVFGGTHGLFSTADDYAKFCLMILHNGSWKGTRILKAETVKNIGNHTQNLYNELGLALGLGFLLF